MAKAWSPDLNPIEHLWVTLKRKVEESKSSNVHRLHDVVMDERKRNLVERCEALVNSRPKRANAVLETNGDQTEYSHFGPSLDNLDIDCCVELFRWDSTFAFF